MFYDLVTAKECPYIINKLCDIGITSNLIGSLSLTNGQCPPPWEVVNETVAGWRKLLFCQSDQNDILRMQDITIPDDTKKATK